MRLHVGSSTVRVEGFLNVDVRPVEGDLVAHAGRLAHVADGGAAAVFATAFLERLYTGQQLAVLREWRRLLGAAQPQTWAQWDPAAAP
jgi:predicted SAM-dependent methyltransferase